MDVLDTTKDTSCQLTSERVPDSVFGLGHGWDFPVDSSASSGGRSSLDRDALLAVNGLARSQVLGDQQILLSSGNKDTSVSVGLLRKV